jgi:hypothetical protein
MGLTSDKQIERTDGVQLAFPVNGTSKIYAGALVCVDADGYLVPGADTAGLIFVGWATQQRDNTSGDDGDQVCVVQRRGLVRCDIASVTQANIGDSVFLVDDETVGLAATTTNDIYCGIIAGYIDATHVWVDIEPAIRQADVATHIADASGAHAASAISITDSGSFTAQTHVEGALAEIYPNITGVQITDPGNSTKAIPVTRSGVCAITTAGAETRTLAIPSFVGQVLVLCLNVDGGDCVVTVASAINQAGNNTITLNDIGDTVMLVGVLRSGTRAWRMVVNDGASLATV